MTPEELSLAVERHCTSKLPDDDLLRISGARLSRRGVAVDRRGQPHADRLAHARQPTIAWEITVEAGAKSAPVPAAAPPGTRVEVRDLFFATPARLKFLKTPRTERELAVDTVTAAGDGLSRQIAFTVTGDDERVLLRLPAGRATARSRLGGVARPRFCREFARDRRRARRLPAERADRPADAEPRHCRATNTWSSTAGRCATNCWSARCAAPIRTCWRATATRSWPCSSTGRRTRSTSTSTRPRPKSGFATPHWCAG